VLMYAEGSHQRTPGILFAVACIMIVVAAFIVTGRKLT
jgi:hypothetical protein